MHNLALLGWAVQFLFALIAAGLFTRDMWRGENGLTVGLLTVSAGVLIFSLLGIFIMSIPGHHTPLVYWWGTVAIWIINIGLGLIAWKLKK